MISSSNPNDGEGDVGVVSRERNLANELGQVTDVGRAIVAAATERSSRPAFGVHYSHPMLDSGQLPAASVAKVTSSPVGDVVSDADVIAGRNASLTIAADAVLQILGTRFTGTQVRDHPRSLLAVRQALSRGGGLLVQTEALDKQAAVTVARDMLGKLRGVSGLEDAASWDDDRALKWLKSMFARVDSLLVQKLTALEEYGR